MQQNVKILSNEIVADHWAKLRRVTYRIRDAQGAWSVQVREAYDRGNGAAILLYDRSRRTVILTRQFRLPTFINGNEHGMMVEACAGVLDEADPEACVRREAEEETGYRPVEVEKVFEAYMSPGSVTERLYLYVAPYAQEMKQHAGGGLDEEEEDIEVLELPFDKAYAMIGEGTICDAKTIMLLQHLKIRYFGD